MSHVLQFSFCSDLQIIRVQLIEVREAQEVVDERVSASKLIETAGEMFLLLG
jgi:hypothetical protein